MKYLVLLCDGMADLPYEALDNKTPMQLAYKPTMDALAQKSEVGLVKTVAEGLKPGSDVANLSVLGYDPKIYYSGRSPLEAASIGVQMLETDVSLRCNLVTLSEDEPYEQKVMVDYSAGDISTEDAKILIDALKEHFDNSHRELYAGVAYRHCLILHESEINFGTLTPPHDITDKVVTNYLPSKETAGELLEMMRESYEVLSNHPLNIERVKKGLRPANSMWLWGEGKSNPLASFKEKYGIDGAMISAVDLLKGIGKLAGMQVPTVEGATGYIDTNFKGKADSAVNALKSGCDFAYIHLEAPDECGHRGEALNKVKALEIIDKQVLSPVLAELEAMGDFKIMILPDHPTPLCTKTHSSDPVPYLIYDSRKAQNGVEKFTEETAKSTGIYKTVGFELIDEFIKL